MGQTTTDTSLSCAECRRARPLSQANEIPRPPCPDCGATAIAFAVGITEELNLATSVSATLKPGDQTLGWSRQWEAVQEQLTELLTPRTDDLSGKAVKDARDDLLGFYVRAFHIKDALKVEAARLGLDKKTVEGTVTADPALALLGGLANLVKHHGKGRNPMSGYAPEIGEASGTSDEGGWRLELPIQHAGNTRDGTVVAQEAVDAWQRLLKDWGLI